MKKDNFTEIENIIGEIKKESENYIFKGDIISKVSYILKEKQQKSLLYYKQILGISVILLVMLNVIQGMLLVYNRQQIALMRKLQENLKTSALANNFTPDRTVIPDRPSVDTKHITQMKQMDKKVPSIQKEKEEKKSELIYASTKDIGKFMELYNLFNSTISPVIPIDVENDINNNSKKEVEYEAI
ncbi:MAG: hypothetical protein N3D17_01315 [bacterium]|nr:hypothetical protein [bacterium]